MTRHGAPDWSVYRIDSATYTVMDLAELAARLGSVVTYDRRGDVVFLDTFQHGRRNWQHTPSGEGVNSALSPDYFVSNGYSLAVTCPSDAPFRVAVHRYTPFPPHGAIGLEVAFTLDLYTKTFKLELYTNDGIDQVLTYLLYTFATKRLQYVPLTGAAVDLEPKVDIHRNPRIFNRLKLVVDHAAKTYVRAMLNHQSFPMTGIPARNYGSTITPNLFINAEWVGTEGQNPVVYLDNLIVTQDEP